MGWNVFQWKNYRHSLQTKKNCIRLSCTRKNALEKGVDGGQKKRCKQILLCKVSNWPPGLTPDKEASSEDVGGVTYVELQTEGREKAAVNYFMLVS
jgi:hypothetical protein